MDTVFHIAYVIGYIVFLTFGFLGVLVFSIMIIEWATEMYHGWRHHRYQAKSDKKFAKQHEVKD